MSDGTVTGIRHAEIVNWTGQAVACPRNKVSGLSGWEESQLPGVYFLFGFSDTSDKPTGYIGEAENVLIRLQDHLVKKDFWNEIIFFTNKDENLTTAASIISGLPTNGRTSWKTEDGKTIKQLEEKSVQNI